MNISSRKNHMIDYIFPIALLFVFAASALMVLLLSANVYSQNTKTTQENDKKNSPLSYISEKMRQSDCGGNISITKHEGISCLTFPQEIDGVPYVTYLYAYDGMMKELFIQSDANITLKNGNDIMACCELKMNEKDKGIFSFSSTDENGSTANLILTERSAP